MLCWQLLQFYAASFETLQVLGHGLKMCMSFGYNPLINLCYFIHKLNRHYYIQSEYRVGTLCAQLLLQSFYADSFETLFTLLSWSEDVHVIFI